MTTMCTACNQLMTVKVTVQTGQEEPCPQLRQIAGEVQAVTTTGQQLPSETKAQEELKQQNYEWDSIDSFCQSLLNS